MTKKVIYKRLRLLCCLSVLITLWNCKSKDITASEKYADNLTTLKILQEKEIYNIEIDVAYPFVKAATQQVANTLFLSRTGNTANRIDVRGDGYFINIVKDSVKGDLSFMGERRLSGGTYGMNRGIAFEGVPKNLEKSIDKKNNKLEIKFSINQNGEPSEKYDVRLLIFPNNKAEVEITSTFKTFMRYSGTLQLVDEFQ
ncbi:uncharacterized protein DUF4251 [Winogradskyella eximia]|uniref:Uncharacterized protein DUF4251 n=1 Tax=Winogradskyella eximia TaxID=262006 RepID=A0A3D9H731_9FLAO|nr:uncharacterized protein DUF4251 [Winogradskyella eximia]